MSESNHDFEGVEAYTLFHVLLASHHGFLSDLEAHLGCLIVHEAAKCRRELTSSARLLARATHLAIRTPII